MVKILMVGNDESVKGGITTVINQFKRFNWKDNNIEFKFIPTYIDKVSILKVLFFAVSYIKIFIYCLFKRPNIVHIHMSYKGSFTRAFVIQKLSLFFRIKTIVHLHGSEFKMWYDSCSDKKKNKIHRFIAKCTCFIVLGERWYKVIKKIVPTANVVILNNSINLPHKKARYNENKTLLFLGVLIKRKGVHDLIKALRMISDNNYQLLIAGVGEEEDNLRKMVSEYNLNDKVKFLGWVDINQKEDLLLKAQFMVLPSYNEGLPMSILEAMSYGIPILSTMVGDIPSVVENGCNGYLYNPGDIKSLSNYLNKAISMSNKLWSNMSEKSKKTVENSYSEDKYFSKMIDIYTENV